MKFPAFPLLLALLLGTALLTAAPVRSTAAQFAVTTFADSGPGSLRQAILDANAAAGGDTVVFSIPGGGTTPVLNLTGKLPEVTGPLAMDGASQPGAALVKLKFSGLAPGESLLTLSGGGCSIKNLHFLSAAEDTVAVTVRGGDGNLLEGLSVGATPAFPPVANDIGAFWARDGFVIESNDNTIQKCKFEGLITWDGICITGSRNTVKECRIAFPLGFMPVLNVTAIGVHLIGGSENVIGAAGKAARFAGTPLDRNLIAGNCLMAIHVEGGSGHRILANECRASGSGGTGIKVDGGAENIVIDGPFVDGGNTSCIGISGPASNVRVRNFDATGVLGVFVGNGVEDIVIEDGQINLPWSGTGIRLEGGDTPSGPVLIRHNTIEDGLMGILVAKGMGEVTIGTRRDASSLYSNRIRGNSAGGIVVRDPAARVRISENLINNQGRKSTNALLINLQPTGEADGTETPNDPLDADSGPNGLQNKPVLLSLEARPAGVLQVGGNLSSKPSTVYTIEALASEPLGTGRWLGSGTMTTDADGQVAFSFPVTGCKAGWRVTLTATSPDGETSEFSNDAICPAMQSEFPVLAEQASISLPENEAATGAAFTIERQSGVTTAYNARVYPTVDFPNFYDNPLAVLPIRYRFNVADAWSTFTENSGLLIPFGVNDDHRVLYLAANEDSTWDPLNKPSVLRFHEVYPPPLGPDISKIIKVQFPDNDPPPAMVLGRVAQGMPFESSVEESYQENLTLRLDRSITGELKLRISVNPEQSTALAGQDFTFSPEYVDLRGGKLEGQNQIRVTAVNDALVEGDEIIAFNVVSVTPGADYSSLVKLTLRDNDFYQASVGDAEVAEGNSGPAVLNFPVTLNQVAPADITFNWTTAGGTAVEGSDFTGSSGTVTIPAGSTSTFIPVVVTGDTAVERTESFSVTLSSPTPSSAKLGKASASGRILNDDRLVISIADVSVSEGAGTVTFTATINEPAPFAVSMGYSVSQETATWFADFSNSGPTGLFNFPAGATSASGTLAIINDSTPEAEETFNINLSFGVKVDAAETFAFTDGIGVVTIRDDDFPSLAAPSFRTVMEGDEGLQTVPVNLTLSTPAFTRSSVDWQVNPGSAAMAASGTAVFESGASSAVIHLTIPGNRIPQPDRVVKLTLSNPVNLRITNAEQTVLTVLDNDQRVVSGSGFSRNEGDSGANEGSFRISIPLALEVPVSVHYQTADGTARAGHDYAAASGTATIPAGATEALIPVSITADTIYEENESFSLILSSPVNATLGSAPLIGSILNDDAQPSLSVSSAVVTASAGGSFQAWIEVKLGDGGSGVELPVSYKITTRDDTALADVHYTPIRGKKLTFQPGRGTEWIAVTVAGMVADNTARRFYVDFAPVAGPASTVTADVSIEPLRVTDFRRLVPGLFFIQFPTGKGQNYVVQEAQSLTGPWVDNSSILLGSGSPVSQAVASSKSRAYFRVRSYSNPPSTAATLTP
ncbi:MAG: Calx-beta domain-containing protein [Verrucomicrobiota bacterium]